MSKKKRVAIYTSSAQARKPLALALQRTRCEEWAAERELDVVKVYESSGDTDTYLDLLNDLQRSEFDGVVATDLPRYSRRAPVVQHLVDVARQAGVRVYTLEEPDVDLTSPVGSFTLRVLAIADEYAVAVTRKEEVARQRRDS
ncbi:recombinase family protein [Streptomyces sp. NPDC045456]|uniref:recombinase family protein n=1 Tax=Streptomyces sp. NPDC045456 TaxID=3155254 RepID=UPI0034026F17